MSKTVSALLSEAHRLQSSCKPGPRVPRGPSSPGPGLRGPQVCFPGLGAVGARRPLAAYHLLGIMMPFVLIPVDISFHTLLNEPLQKSWERSLFCWKRKSNAYSGSNEALIYFCDKNQSCSGGKPPSPGVQPRCSQVILQGAAKWLCLA